MNAPECRSCRTDKYLRITDYQPVSYQRDDIQSLQRVIRRPQRRVEAEAEYFCGRCGAFDRHSVPEEWARPRHEMTNSDIMAECGQYAPRPGVITRPNPDGETMTTRL